MKKLRILRLKEVMRIAKHHMWREALPKETVKKMMAIPGIINFLYAYFKTGDSYVFHNKDSDVYWCVSRNYLLRNHPKFLKDVEEE